MKKIILILTALLNVTCANEQVKFYKPSFSCEKVKNSSVEYKICRNENLSDLDNELNKIYKSFKLITNDIKQEQIVWIKQRNKCKDNSCIKNKYQTRIENLNTSLSNQNTFSKKMLDIMKISQKAIKVTSIMIKEKEMTLFLKDLFIFKNIIVNKPILHKVDYNNTKLKDLLGNDCWNMRLDFEVSLKEDYSHFKRYEAHQIKKFSLWETNMDGDDENELILAQYKNNNYIYNLLDKEYCKKFTSTPYTDKCLEDMRKNYSNEWYDFFDTNNKLINSYCTINQKIVGKFNNDLKRTITVVNWKKKSYLLTIYNYQNIVVIGLYGTKKLNFLGQRNYNYKQKKEK